jgi:HlyD family secretion protein
MSWKVWLLCALLVGGSGAGVVRYRSAHDKPRARYATVAVVRGPVAARVTANGTLSALVTVQVGSQVSGRIREMRVDFNSKVKKGDVLAKIDPQLFQATVAQTRAHQAAALGALAKAKTNAQIAARRLGRSRTLAEKNLIAEADLDQTEADAESAQGEVEAAKGNAEEAVAAMRQAQINLMYTTILSPVDGVVISRNVDVGQTVAASLQAPTLFTIAGDLGKMQVDTSVAEADVGKLRSGMPAVFTVDAYPSTEFRGVVREVRNAPQTIQNVVTYDAVIDVDNADLRLKPGMTAHVSFIYAERSDVLKVPNAALRFRPASDRGSSSRPARRRPAKGSAAEAGPAPNQRTLWLSNDDAPAPVEVQTGVSDGVTTEIVSGPVRAGDQVIVELIDSAGADGSPAASRAPTRLRLF